MSFLDKIERARDFLERNKRVSLRVVKREFDLDEEGLEELVEELVDIQKIAATEGKVLVWVGPSASEETRESLGAAPERRQLTVMFCDVVGSTGLAERLDAEDFRNVLRAYQEFATSVTERYEGHVAQFLGDGILVYFGYPRAHDEDAELAVRAGREILMALGELNDRLELEYGIRLALRVGIHTGSVVVGEMGSGGSKSTLALGGTTNIAARLQGLAQPDSVVISGATLRLVAGVFVTEDLGTWRLKGIAQPVRAHAVLRTTGVRSRLNVDPSRLTPLVGRDRELGLLLERREQVQEGEGHAVLITGEAGLGKSRLVQAFRGRLIEEPHTWLECHCTPYTRASAFFPLIEILEKALRFRKPEDSEPKLRSLERAVERAGLSVPDVVPLIAPLLMLPLPDRYPAEQRDPALRRKKTIETIVSWILALAEQQLMVVVFEDLHWCDSSTLEVVGMLLQQNPKSNVLTLLTSRPDFEPRWPAHPHVTHLEVGRLRRRQAENLVASMSDTLALPRNVVECIVERADGVPLFLEELTKMVLESGLVEEHDGRLTLTGDLATLAIPTTLQGSLMARLDRLSAAREVAQRTAVLGREFSYALAAASVGFEEGTLRSGLARLVEADILFERGKTPNSSYLFKHALLQEAAYESLLRETRQQLHGRVLDALLERFSEHVTAAPELAARHAEAAMRTDAAIEYYQRAGSHAQERSAHEEAVGHLRRAIELLGPDDGVERDRLELSLQLALGASLTAVRGYAHPERRVAYERARVLGEAVQDPTPLGQALIGVSISECTGGAMETARSVAARVLTSAEERSDDELALHGHCQVALPEYYQGRFGSSLKHCERAIALYDPPRHHKAAFLIGGDTGFAAMGVSAWNLWHLGYPDQALARARETVELTQHFEDPFGIGFSAMVQGTIHWLRGEFEGQEQTAASQIAVGEEYGFPVWLGLGKAIHAAARVALGDTTAVAELLEGAALLAETGTQSGAPMLFAMLAATQAAAGSSEEALGAVDLGLAVAAGTGQAFEDAELHRLKGELTLTVDREGAAESQRLAEESFHKAAEVARLQEARSLELRALTSLARLLIAQDRMPEAQTLLLPAYQWFTEGLETADLRDARSVLERTDGASAVAASRSNPETHR
jgi:class 3 adenylate cyclase/tetratricopeptide (TPR) repeat protein